MRRLPAALLAVALVSAGVAAGAGCNKSEPGGPVDGSIDPRIAELEREVRGLKDEREAALRAAGVTGSEKVSLSQSIERLVERMSRLEASQSALAAATATGPAAAMDGGASSSATSPTLGLPPSIDPQSDGAYTEEQIAKFGKLMEAVQRKRDEDAQRERLRQGLAQAGLTLTAEQEATVLRLQKEFQQKRQDLFQASRGMNAGMQTEADAAEMRTKMEELRAGFEVQVREVVPAADADKVVEAMKRQYPGFFSRPDRNDRNDRTRPNRGGN